MTIRSLEEYRQERKAATAEPGSAEQTFTLPIAPNVIARTRFSPPMPPPAACLHMDDALLLLKHAMQEGKKDGVNTISMAAIIGPGDPLASPELTLETMRKVHDLYPDLPLGIRTLGLTGSYMEHLAEMLFEAGVHYMEVDVEATDTDVLEKLYAWIRPGKKTLKIAEAATILLKEQASTIRACVKAGMKVYIRTTLYPGYNMEIVAKTAKDMQALGASGIILVPYTPSPGVEVDLESPSPESIQEKSTAVQAYLPLETSLLPDQDQTVAHMSGCTCGASTKGKDAQNTSPLLPKPSKERPNVAVASSNGMDVDLHLGQAGQFLIYGPREDGLTCLLGTRKAPVTGAENRWQQVADHLSDCCALLVANAGTTPKQVLREAGLPLLVSQDPIEGLVDVLYGGGKKKGCKSK